MARTSIDQARAYLAKIPGAISGQGGDKQTFKAACSLVNGFALSPEDALALLSEYNARCQPPWSEKELHHKIESAVAAHHLKPRGHLLSRDNHHFNGAPTGARKPPRPRIDSATQVENFLKGFRCSESELGEASPVKPPSNWRLGGVSIMPFLYQDGEFINLNHNYELAADGKVNIKGQGEILPRNEWTEKLSREPFESGAGAWIRMNPTRQAGTGYGGAICDADITSCRFALLECDDALPPDLQRALFVKLPLPVTMILSSGGRSIHVWVRIGANDLDDYRKAVAGMLDPLFRFGIDTQNKNVSRYSRLPGAQRQLGALGDGQQRLLYLNPNPKPEAIL